ncbi:hypothetical protein E4U21_007934 [Claviceps maximensis]|nr:hypothetical protein E4U21_007934 [Claviceps maximensis]
MDSLFTREEKRFVLAEILKSSDVGVEHLWQFIQENQIVPNWMNIQVPLGRSLSQCIKVVEQMKNAPLEPRVLSAGHSVGSSRCQQLQHTSEDGADARANRSSPSSTSTPMAIVPRPATGQGESLVSASSSEHNRPRKRGRPSRADRARINLFPNLPPHLAPRSLSRMGYRPILPAAALQTGHSDSVQPSFQLLPPILSKPPELERYEKRRRLDDIAQMQQASSAAIETNMAPEVSSGAI